MWSNYKKVFKFRDCFEKWQMEGDIIAVNDLLKKEQKTGNKGAYITSDIIGTDIATGLYISRDEDDLSWVLDFSREERTIATASTFDFKEIQLCFEIEEELNTGVMVIHDCEIKGFKEYQM